MSDGRTLRDALTEALCGPGLYLAGPETTRRRVDALLPVVEAECRRRAAEELRAAAEAAHHGFINSRNDEGEQWAQWLRARADAIERRP